jgi:hypothetical protein
MNSNVGLVQDEQKLGGDFRIRSSIGILQNIGLRSNSTRSLLIHNYKIILVWKYSIILMISTTLCYNM